MWDAFVLGLPSNQPYCRISLSSNHSDLFFGARKELVITKPLQGIVHLLEVSEIVVQWHSDMVT